MQADKPLYRELTYKIIGILFKVHKNLGYWVSRKIYQGAIEMERKKEDMPYQTEKEFKVKYEDEDVDCFPLDLIIDNKVILELRAVERLPKVFREQLIAQLKAAPYEVGCLANFGPSKLEYICIVRSKSV